jgi:hypothetical protein
MNIAWVLSQSITLKDASIDPKVMGDIGPIWGTWESWKEFQTDNVISTNIELSQQLVEKAFHAVCNLWVDEQHFEYIGSPKKVHTFKHNIKGHFGPAGKNFTPANIINLELASRAYDLLVVVGFDIYTPHSRTDLAVDGREVRDSKHRYLMQLIKIIKKNPNVQYVFADVVPCKNVYKPFKQLENFTVDSNDNVVKFLTQS